MKKLWALCLTALVVSGGSCEAAPDAMLSSLSSRYETMKAKILPTEDNNEYAKKTQERWNNSQNAKTANICIWVDENDDNILHVRYRGQSCSLKYNELIKYKNASYLNGLVRVNNNTDGRWLNVRVVSQLGCGANIFWYKGSIIMRYNKYSRNIDTDESFALLAENVYIDSGFIIFDKITIGARNELWNLGELHPDWLDVCELISYRIYNLGSLCDTNRSVSKHSLSMFFAKFYKEIAQPEHLMQRGFFSCYSICIKRPVKVEDLPISLYGEAHLSDLNQTGDKKTRYIKIAQPNMPDDLVNRWMQYFDPQNNKLRVRIGQLKGTTNINYKFSDNRIDLPEIENCIKSDTKGDYAFPEGDIRRIAYEEAIRHYNSKLDFVRNNGNIKVNTQDSQTINENGVKMAKGYKSQIECDGKKISDITFDPVPAFTECYDAVSGTPFIDDFVFYTKEGLPFSYEVDCHLSCTLEEYIFNKTVGRRTSGPNRITFKETIDFLNKQGNHSNKAPEEIPTNLNKTLDNKVDFFNKHGHAPK